MHKVFGCKEAVPYLDREGAYLIPLRGRQVGVVHTSKGYFLLGGGLEPGESHLACIARECLEESGYTVSAKQQICSAETYATHPTLGYFHPIQTYYVGELLTQIASPSEADHRFVWIDYDFIKGNMVTEMQNWALEQCAAYIQG